MNIITVKPFSFPTEKELETILVNNPGQVEEGLQTITHQLSTDSGPLDILAVDGGGRLVVIELKNEASENHLDQGLRYYDWCCQNISWIANAYKAKTKISDKSMPRLMLIAPAFTETVRRIAKYVYEEANLALIEFHAFETEKGERGIICTKIDIDQVPFPPDLPTIDNTLEYFESAEVKNLFLSVTKELENRQLEVKPIRGPAVSVWYRGKRFIYMDPRRNFFVLDVLKSDDTWTGKIRVSTQKEWDQAFKGHIETYMQYLDANK